MQPRLQATLADFVPALRFVAPELVAEYLEHENLPAAWWMSVPVVRAANTFGRDELPGRLADLAYTELRHLRLGDLLPGAWLASNGFRLSQWPDSARTNVMVRTPDWADLLTTTVREVGDWTQIGTSTVRPLVARLFEEVLGLLPSDDESMDVDAVMGLPPVAAREPVEAAAVAAPTPEAEPEIEPRPEVEPEPVPEPVAEDAGTVDDMDAMLEDWRELDEDELRPVEAPVPLTDELGVVVRWLAQQAPDVPLMAQLAQVTLETAAVVGLEEATPQVHTALTALLSQVPSGLRSSLVLPPAPRADEAEEAVEPVVEPESDSGPESDSDSGPGPEPVDAFGETPPVTQASVPTGRDAYGEIPPTTQAAVPVVLPPKPPTAPEPARDPKLRTADHMSDAPAGRTDSRAEPAPAARGGRAKLSPEPPTEADHAEDPGLDAYGEVPPGTVADIPLRTVKGGATRAEPPTPA
ncbi:hypothetical protein GT354_48440, partial [Streptomyces sp. SID3343]|nr:hypothetical protein [Streptomyces sp. SID3343]